MSQIIAINSKGQKQRFSEYAWKLLGKNKGDWTEVGAQTVGNAIIEKAPVMGPAVQKVGNAVKKEKTIEEIAEEERIEENAKKFDEKFNGTASEEKVISEAQKAEFMKEANALNRGSIKDIFDSQKPKVEYNNKSGVAELRNQLAEFCKYDVIKFQEIFSK